MKHNLLLFDKVIPAWHILRATEIGNPAMINDPVAWMNQATDDMVATMPQRLWDFILKNN